MDDEHPLLEVGTSNQKGFDKPVFMIYKDGQSAHAGTRRSYFYDAVHKPLRGPNYINKVTFLPKYREHWQEFLSEDNRTFIKNKSCYGEPLRKRTMEKAYVDWVASEKERLNRAINRRWKEVCCCERQSSKIYHGVVDGSLKN
ncbi:hypothetical protein BOTCAL_0097g00150 [Botryotinia calthae]|uniref:Uncharacterized protein n=1 Tax=Botryotinia calthae TaxID=38488 RepID=A0A4Y8D6G1_9HELO|nr:hypothetical protein BOTCAL_0097g00150 [Botryotinia calthae]